MLPRDKYWERYRFSFQAVDKSASETDLIVAIDEAKEEKNGDNIKVMPIRSPIGDDHREESRNIVQSYYLRDVRQLILRRIVLRIRQ